MHWISHSSAVMGLFVIENHMVYHGTMVQDGTEGFIYSSKNSVWCVMGL